MKYPAYPKYRDIGQGHLPRMPAHWAVKRVKFIAKVGNGSTPNRDESAYWLGGTFPWLNSSVVNKEVVTQADQFVTSLALRECHLPRVQPPAVLVGITGEGRTRGMATTLAFEATINQHLAYVKPMEGEVDVGYLRRVFDSAYPFLRSESEGGGSTKGAITCEQIAELAIPLPALPEQEHIAAFLDWKTAQIDALITKKQELIERLKEKRLAVITHAVTKGLNPGVGLKDSTIPWATRIPNHWQSGNIRRFTRMKTGHTPSRSEPSYWLDCDISWFTLADVWQLRDGQQVYLGETREKISKFGLDNSAAELLPKGTVVFSRTASVGYSGVMPQPMATSQDYWNWIPDSLLISEYLLLQFRAMGQEFQRMTMGSTHKTIYQPDAASLRVCVPPLTEQEAIVEFVFQSTKRVDAMLEKVQQAVGRLAEYRTALITAAVTGQIDVRHITIPTPA